MPKTVIVFSQPSCAPCQRVKEYLQNKKVTFTVKDISEGTANLKELVEQYHSQSTPTTIINGQVVIGFNKDRIDKLLER
jgi:glutaredoxin-like YruB-family protein